MEVIGESVVVAGEKRKRTISFPRDLVFEFDAELFGRLSSAYAEGNAKAARQLWAQVRSFVSDSN